MNYIDIGIIVVIVLSFLAGIRRGFVKEIVFLVGLVLVMIISFKLRLPVSTFLYKNLPFISDSGLFSKFSSLNILFYELLAFLITMSVLYLVLRILLIVSGIIEKILKCTIILGLFSRIGGAILGAIEGYIIVFIILFIINLPFFSVERIEDSKYSNFILNKTPILSNSVNNLLIVSDEIKVVIDSYNKDNSKDFNDKTIDIMLKYNIVSEENINYLKERGKIE